jgi:uncharacterized delta-60 repeat protein
LDRSVAYDLVIQSDGRILVVGSAQQPGGTYQAVLVRLISDGSLDDSFGTNGVVVTPPVYGLSGAQSIQLRPDGRIIIAAVISSAFILVGYDGAGNLDQGFGNGGFAIVSMPFPVYGVADMALTSDGRLVAVGTARPAGEPDIVAFRVMGPETTPAEGGPVVADLELGAPRPNPATHRVWLPLTLSRSAHVRLAVFDQLGREVMRLAEGQRDAGEHLVEVDVSGLSPGVYLVRLVAGDRIVTRSITAIGNR